MSTYPNVIVQLQRLAMIRRYCPKPDPAEKSATVNALIRDIWDALEREGCRDCPPGCPECTVDRDCECYEHPDAELGTAGSWPYPVLAVSAGDRLVFLLDSDRLSREQVAHARALYQAIFPDQDVNVAPAPPGTFVVHYPKTES